MEVKYCWKKVLATLAVAIRRAMNSNQIPYISFLGLCINHISCVANEGDDPLDWLRDSLPGEPGVDYPILATVQESSFSCSGLVFGGYYADPEQDCQAYHVCLSDPLDQESLYPVSFLCPNGTIFNQEIFVCDWW